MFGLLRRRKPVETHALQPAERRALGDDLLAIFGAVPAASGVHVTATSAMRVPAVANAVGLISEAVGSLPAKLFERIDGGGKEVAADHPAAPLVHRDANPWTSASAFRAELTRDALLHSAGGFALAVRAGGRIAELHRLNPGSVTVETDDLTGEPVYRLRQQGRPDRVHGFADVIHVTSPGGSPIELAREAIALAIVLERHGATFFGRGGKPDGVLTTSAKLGAEAAKRMGAAWKAAFGGGRSGGTPVLEEDLKYQPITFNSVDSQYEQLRRFQILEICRAFRIAPIFLQEYGRATWSNSSEMGRQFLQYTLLPWLRQWEAAYRRVLLSPEERASHSVEFVVDDLLRADIATRATAYSQFRAAGILTANEIRALENRPPLPGGDSLANPYTSTGGSE